MPISRNINKDFFKKWSHKMAYILGFLFADGNIICTNRGTWFWSIQITDLDILLQMRDVLKSNHKISERKNIINHKKLYRIQIGSGEMCEDLMKLGLVERKSKIISFPSVPERYLTDFIRGYFDGDGGVWFGLKNQSSKNKNYVLMTYFTSGSKIFLTELRKILKKMGLLGGSLVRKEKGFELKYSIIDSFQLYKIMYNTCDPKLFLKRKKNRFKEYVKMRS